MQHIGMLTQCCWDMECRALPGLAIGLAFKLSEVLEEELHTVLGLLHNAAVYTGHTRLQTPHNQLSCTSQTYPCKQLFGCQCLCVLHAVCAWYQAVSLQIPCPYALNCQFDKRTLSIISPLAQLHPTCALKLCSVRDCGHTGKQ